MAQKSELGMQYLHITAGHQYSTHSGTKINDIGGSDSGIDYFYPPFDCKVVNIESIGAGNSVTFQSIGQVYIPKFDFPVDVCFRCTHANGLNIKDSSNEVLKIGSIFYKDGGKFCYLEGTSGISNGGNHIHVEFAVGVYQKTQYDNVPCRYMITNVENSQLLLCEAVFIKPGTTVIENDPNENYYVNQYVLTLSTGLKGTVWYFAKNGTQGARVKMVLHGSAARTRSDVMGTERTIVAKGGTIEVIDLYDWKAGDGYRWGWGIGNGISGAFQYDPNVMYPLGSPNPAHNNLWMKVLADNVPMYYTISGAQTGVFAYNGSSIKIIEFVSSSWFYGEFQGRRGYFLYNRGIMYPYGNC
ncbi:MAG: hypothetical protein RR700_06230 [Anaerorhabdus sp.]|uniref:hypothetical protein n=1 Tax=Anaerorhabdus sp. TaxID=1872524 RepID=UPI002FCA977E